MKHFQNYVKKLLGDKIDTVDYKGYYDPKLTLQENKNNFYNIVLKNGIIKPNIDHMELKTLEQDHEKEQYKKELENIKKEEQKEINRLKKKTSTEFIDSFYWELEEKLKTLIKGRKKLLFCFGEAGIGKTYQTERILARYNVKFQVMRGVSTPASMHNTLSDYSDDIILLDDVESMMCHRSTISTFKSATEKPNIVHWNSLDKRIKKTSFQFKGKIVIILNDVPQELEFRNLLSRALIVRIHPNYNQKLMLMYEIAKKEKIPIEIVDYIKEYSNTATKNFDLRVLEKAYDFYTVNKEKWKELIISELKPDKMILALRRAIEYSNKVGEQAREFTKLTGLGRRSFFLYKAKTE